VDKENTTVKLQQEFFATESTDVLNKKIRSATTTHIPQQVSTLAGSQKMKPIAKSKFR